MATYYLEFSIKIIYMQQGEKNNIELMKSLGNIIKKHRLDKNKTIYKISAEAEMSKSTWREIELGLCNDVTLSSLYKISNGLEIPLEKLFEELNNLLGKDFFNDD